MATATPATPAPQRSHTLRNVFLILVLLVLALVALISTRPTEMKVERSAQIGAPPEVVFPLIDNVHEWAKWSPYDKLDPKMKKTFTGPDAGVGASYSWTGNSEVGEGSSTVVESKPNEEVVFELKFLKPFEATCHATFTLVPVDGGTKVTWKMDGTNNFVAKAMSLVMDMDKMVGDAFDKGLANMDKVAKEQSAEPKVDGPKDDGAQPPSVEPAPTEPALNEPETKPATP